MLMLKKPPRLRLEKATAVAVDLDVTSPFGSRRAKYLQRLIWQICDWRILPQNWRRILRKKFARKVQGPFDIAHRGMKLRLYPAENYCDRVLFGRKQLPELAEHEALADLIKPGMVFVDIGANVGSYSLFVGTKASGDLTLIGFEPHPRTYQKLVFNLQANGLSTELIFNQGVADRSGMLELWSDGGSNIGHTSMLKEGTANPKVANTVKVEPLVDVIGRLGIDHVDLLKIDIEGFEDRALAGYLGHAAPKLLPNHILMETAHSHLWEQDLTELLVSADYSVVFETAENRLYSRNAVL